MIKERDKEQPPKKKRHLFNKLVYFYKNVSSVRYILFHMLYFCKIKKRFFKIFINDWIELDQ